MPVYRIIGFYRDAVSGFGWSVRNFRSQAIPADAFTAFDTWNTVYLAACSTQVKLVGATVEDIAGGQPTNFLPFSSFTAAAGSLLSEPLPTADGLMYVGYGGLPNKGQSHWILHGIPVVRQADSNTWDTTAATLVALRAACDAYLFQFRKAVSPVHGYPVVNPPVPFPASNMDSYIRLRRTGRPFLHGGQGLRNR